MYVSTYFYFDVLNKNKLIFLTAGNFNRKVRNQK